MIASFDAKATRLMRQLINQIGLEYWQTQQILVCASTRLLEGLGTDISFTLQCSTNIFLIVILKYTYRNCPD